MRGKLGDCLKFKIIYYDKIFKLILSLGSQFPNLVRTVFFFRYLVERAVERLRRQGEAQFAGVSADLEAR